MTGETLDLAIDTKKEIDRLKGILTIFERRQESLKMVGTPLDDCELIIPVLSGTNENLPQHIILDDITDFLIKETIRKELEEKQKLFDNL